MSFKFITPKALGKTTTISDFVAEHRDTCRVSLALVGHEPELLKRNIISLEYGETVGDRWLVIFTDAHCEAFPTEEAAKEFLLKKYGGQTA